MGQVKTTLLKVGELNYANTDADAGFVLTTDGAGNLSLQPVPAAAAVALDALTDVAITTPADGHMLVFDGTQWVNQAPEFDITQALDDLTDVVITTPAEGHVLTYNGTEFVNAPLPVPAVGKTYKGTATVAVADTPIEVLRVPDFNADEPRQLVISASANQAGAFLTLMVDAGAVLAGGTVRLIGEEIIHQFGDAGTDALELTFGGTATELTITGNGDVGTVWRVAVHDFME